MKLTELLLADLNREVDLSRRALEQVPEGRYDWKPHERSMTFGYLAELVAIIPSWIDKIVTRDEWDIAPPDGPATERAKNETSGGLLQALEKAAAGAQTALAETNEEHLLTRWRLLARGQVVWEGTRHEMIRDTVSHWAHHRGQMTVYLRLLGAKVPALYGPSADDSQFQ